MKFDLVKEELSSLLSTLTEQFERMDSNKNTIPQIEIDIFMKNIQELYESTIELKKANKPKQEKELPIQSNRIEESVKKVIEEEVQAKIEIVDIKETETYAPVIQEKEEIIEQEVKAEIEEIPSHIESSFDDILEEPKEDIKDESDLFTHIKANQEILDLNKKLAEARGNHSLAEKLQNQQIESLKSVIGINDKFYFINELFNGEAHKYEDVIYTLNNFKKLDDAMQYFSTLKYRFNWTEESEAAEKLVHMLERKFDLINA